MDKPKTKVVKSKSSNSTSETKKNTQKNNKKSRSNAEFQPKTTVYNQGIQPLLKKRGVYVENKVTKISINNRDQSPEVLTNILQSCAPRPIPRPGRKRFLASVLTILSKSTTGTQCPDVADRLRIMEKTKDIRKKRTDDEVIHEVSVTTPNISKRKPIYRSRVLNNYADREVEPVVVLQSTKYIAPSPSNNSECIHDKNTVSTCIDPENLRWAESLLPLHQQNLETAAPVATNSKNVRLVDNEPTTMISDIPERVDKNFYNFFVDVLKTSLSVYNVETELTKELTNANSSLEINESVLEKLNSIQKIKEPEFKETSDVSRKPSSKYFYSIQPDEYQEWNHKQLLEHFQPDYSKQYKVESPKRRRSLKSDSFNYRRAKPLPNTPSLPLPNRRKTQKNDRKKEFINLLKEQLQMKADTNKEPQNFYQALKVIAKNKRRCQQATAFKASKRPSEGDFHVCQFKRRRVLSAKPSGKQSNYYLETHLDPFTFNPYVNTRYKKRTIIGGREKEIDESKHSLEVVGYDYETNKKPKVHVQSNWVSRLPSPLTLIEDYDHGLLMDYSESGTSTMMPQSGQFKCL